VRDAEALETLSKVDTIVVDKTGTLTEGKPTVTSIQAEPGASEDEVLRLAAGLERPSEHPLAAAVLSAAEERRIAPPAVSDFHYLPGKGLTGRIDQRPVALGNRALFDELGIAMADREPEGLLLAVDGRYAGSLRVTDRIKASTPEALRRLRDGGAEIVMLTGDNRAAAEAVARELGIQRFEAAMLPEDKLRYVERLLSGNRMVAMAGDGINDAPALARAHVGIAMGTGTDVAIESAGITLVRGDLRGIAAARRLSREVLKNIRQNLAFAFGYNLLCVPIAAGALYPFFGLLLSPMLAAAAMTFSSVSVIANALRLRRLRL
jgi:Cu+-exporting ATPase